MAVFYKEEAETERYQQEKYLLILPILWLEGSNYFMKKSPKNQGASNVSGWWEESFGMGHCGSKTFRQVQNLTRKTQGRRIHWGPFDTRMTMLTQKIVEHSFLETGKIPQRSITTWQSCCYTLSDMPALGHCQRQDTWGRWIIGPGLAQPVLCLLLNKTCINNSSKFGLRLRVTP